MKASRSASRSKSEFMITTLRNEITAGKYEVGKYLPSELELCSLFGISKMTVRKGLEVLVEEGYIEKVPRIGAKVVSTIHACVITLRFGYYPSLEQETKLLQLIELFHDRYPNLRIQPIPLQYPTHDQYFSSYFQELKLDLMSINAQDYEDIHDLSLLEPMPRNEGVYRLLNMPFMIDEEAVAVQPFVFTPVILCYNREHFKEKNVPEPDACWSWGDVQEASRKLAVPGDRYGLVFHTLSDNRWPLFLLQNGVVFEPQSDGRYHLANDRKLKDALATCKELMSDESLFPLHLSRSDNDIKDLFRRQKVSMMIATYSTLNGLQPRQDEERQLRYDIAPVPFLREAKSLLIVIGLAVSKHSEHKAAARRFVEFMQSEEAQLFLRKHTLSVPALKTAAEWSGKETMNRPPRFHLFRETMNTFRYYTDLNLSHRQLSLMRDELKLYWANLETLDNVLRKIQDKLAQSNDLRAN
ncbi:extracellular solute-binding protein [Paenibacillus sp. J5C_2022]|uniref:extracellular solute-binding protein n=1 Tax=Paenibacillus sp. J5C2022 TaxID=2977129 RepID=UPI0021CFCAAD|nr:extracellular solute-binding protein [Paenibacillus sp. J5C2022]MCU6707578.1 extracellular solute-binding protein [Paenibacillus sp. J5C2022]